MKKIYGSLINGSWVKHKKTFDVRNPFDNSKILEVYDAEEIGTLEAIKSSANAFKEWKKTSAEERSYFLKTFHSLVLKNKKSIAQVITKESGKPLKESYVEVDYGASFIEWSAINYLRNCGKIFESPEKLKECFI